MESISTIQAVVFDLDGTLVDTECLYRRFWVEAARDLGYPMEDRHALMLRSRAAETAIPLLQREVCPDFDYFAVRERRRKIMGTYIEEHGVEAKPGMAETLHALRARGYVLALATQSPESRARQFLGPFGVMDDFSAVISGDQVSHGKPDPEIYLKAAMALSLAPAEILAVEDSPNGVLAGARAGCRVCLIPDQDQPGEDICSLCTCVLPDLPALLPLLPERL